MYEITTNGKKKFNEYIREKIVYSDSVYDFTFEDRFHIYHYKVLDEYRYVALDKKTGYSSAVISTKQPIHPNCYSALVPKILYSIKYTGDRRYLGKYSVPKSDFIDIVFRNILPKYGYAIREEQIRLSKTMFEGLTRKRVTLSEAEVGTGKTMAYLVASLAASLYDERFSMNGNPITISTSSIELQQSIVKKEIPELSRMLMENGMIHGPLVAVIRKGKEHFFCPARYNDFYKEISKYPRKYSETLKILNELDLLNTGLDLDEIGVLNKHIKSKICVRGSCFKCLCKKECRYSEYMEDALHPCSCDFQITNHNMFLMAQKIGKDNRLLQKSNFVIFDEAHKVMESAVSVCGFTLEYDEVGNYLNAIKYSLNDKGRETKKILERFTNAATKYNDKLFQILLGQSTDDSEDDGERMRVTIGEDEIECIEKLISVLEQVDKLIRYNAKYQQLKLTNLLSTLDRFAKPQEVIYWLDITDRERKEITLCGMPKTMEEDLRNMLWSKTHMQYVLTSGTMKDDTGFDYFKAELGISGYVPKEQILETSCESPFNYKEHTRLYISKKTLVPKMNDDEYIRSIANEVEKLIQATHGHTAVLFTSYKVLSAVHKLLEPKLSEYNIIKMTRSNKTAISDFKKSKNAVLFASGSMWEGVDCAGDVLSSVIIVKLPFPLRTEALEQKKANCETMGEFVHTYAVPQMIIKLRQGAGRLIRNETDTGVLAILDARATGNGSYYKRVMNALGKYPVVSSVDEIGDFIRSVKDARYFQ